MTNQLLFFLLLGVALAATLAFFAGRFVRRLTEIKKPAVSVKFENGVPTESVNVADVSTDSDGVIIITLKQPLRASLWQRLRFYLRCRYLYIRRCMRLIRRG